MILAVLDRKAGISFINQDVYVNIVGGLRPEGTSTDLAVALAIYSAYRRIPGSNKTMAMGEIGLTGDLRPVQNAEKIVKEAVRMGFAQVILPRRNQEKLRDVVKGVRLIGVTNVKEAIAHMQPQEGAARGI